MLLVDLSLTRRLVIVPFVFAPLIFAGAEHRNFKTHTLWGEEYGPQITSSLAACVSASPVSRGRSFPRGFVFEGRNGAFFSGFFFALSDDNHFLQRFSVVWSIFSGKSSKGVVEKRMFCRYTPQLSRSDVVLVGRGTGTISRYPVFEARICFEAFLNSECDWSVHVSVDKTLRTRLGLSRSRNVLTRGERIARLIEEDRFAAGRSPLGLPKVRVQKALIGKKKKKTAEEGAAAATPAKGAKGAAKGGKK